MFFWGYNFPLNSAICFRMFIFLCTAKYREGNDTKWCWIIFRILQLFVDRHCVDLLVDPLGHLWGPPWGWGVLKKIPWVSCYHPWCIPNVTATSVLFSSREGEMCLGRSCLSRWKEKTERKKKKLRKNKKKREFLRPSQLPLKYFQLLLRPSQLPPRLLLIPMRP